MPNDYEVGFGEAFEQFLQDIGRLSDEGVDFHVFEMARSLGVAVPLQVIGDECGESTHLLGEECEALRTLPRAMNAEEDGAGMPGFEYGRALGE